MKRHSFLLKVSAAALLVSVAGGCGDKSSSLADDEQRFFDIQQSGKLAPLSEKQKQNVAQAVAETVSLLQIVGESDMAATISDFQMEGVNAANAKDSAIATELSDSCEFYNETKGRHSEVVTSARWLAAKSEEVDCPIALRSTTRVSSGEGGSLKAIGQVFTFDVQKGTSLEANAEIKSLHLFVSGTEYQKAPSNTNKAYSGRQVAQGDLSGKAILKEGSVINFRFLTRSWLHEHYLDDTKTIKTGRSLQIKEVTTPSVTASIKVDTQYDKQGKASTKISGNDRED